MKKHFPNHTPTLHRLRYKAKYWMAPKEDDIWYIERLWAIVSANVYRKPKPTHIKQVMRRVRETSLKITERTLTRLAHQMPAKLQEVYRLKGKKLPPSFDPTKSEWACKCPVCLDWNRKLAHNEKHWFWRKIIGLPLWEIIKFDGFQKNIEWWKAMYLWCRNFPQFFSKNTTFLLESVFGKKRICSKKSLKKRIFSLFISSIKHFCSNLGHDPILGRFARAEIHKIWWLVMIIFQIDCFCTRENVFTNFWDTP